VVQSSSVIFISCQCLFTDDRMVGSIAWYRTEQNRTEQNRTEQHISIRGNELNRVLSSEELANIDRIGLELNSRLNWSDIQSDNAGIVADTSASVGTIVIVAATAQLVTQWFAKAMYVWFDVM
jgi:hypothetical protein